MAELHPAPTMRRGKIRQGRKARENGCNTAWRERAQEHLTERKNGPGRNELDSDEGHCEVALKP